MKIENKQRGIPVRTVAEMVCRGFTPEYVGKKFNISTDEVKALCIQNFKTQSSVDALCSVLGLLSETYDIQKFTLNQYSVWNIVLHLKVSTRKMLFFKQVREVDLEFSEEFLVAMDFSKWMIFMYNVIHKEKVLKTKEGI